MTNNLDFTQPAYIIQVNQKGYDDCDHMQACSVTQSNVKAQSDFDFAKEKLSEDEFDITITQQWLH